MRSFLWLVLILGMVGKVAADPIEEILTYFDPDVPPTEYHPFIRHDRYAVRLVLPDFGVSDSLIIEGIWSSSGMYGPVRVALCEDDTTNPPGCVGCEYSPGDTISFFEYIAPLGDVEDTTYFDQEVRRKDNRPIWVYYDYEAEGVIFATSGTQPPPYGRNIRRLKGADVWWDDYNCNWAVGLVVRYEPAVGIGPESNSPIPQTFTLNQNYPNPFNPQTTISFTLAKRSPVLLSVYDLRGRLMEVLLNTPLSPGQHQMIWKGGEKSGIYFYELRVENEVVRKKMTLVK